MSVMKTIQKARKYVGFIAAAIAALTSGTLVAIDCNKTFDDPGICHLHTGYDYGYSTCESEIVSGPGWNEDYVPKNGTSFIVSSTYKVPYTAEQWRYDKDDVEEVCLTTGSRIAVFNGECNEYSYDPNCSQPPT